MRLPGAALAGLAYPGLSSGRAFSAKEDEVSNRKSFVSDNEIKVVAGIPKSIQDANVQN